MGAAVGIDGDRPGVENGSGGRRLKPAMYSQTRTCLNECAPRMATWLLAASSILFLMIGTLAAEARKVALVVGISEYETVADLRNAAGDASAISRTLASLGFDVTTRRDLGRDAFAASLMDFYRAAEGADAALFFYSGHGFQISGNNYIVPADAQFSDRASLGSHSLPLDEIAAELRGRSRHTLIFLDACRNDPLPPGLGQTADGLAPLDAKRLTPVNAGDGGTFVAFATEPGNISTDGKGAHSPFAAALIEHLPTRGISIADMMIRIRNAVQRETEGRQTPWDQSSLRSQFYFNPDEAQIADELVAREQSAASSAAAPDVAAKLIILPVGVERGQLATSFRAEVEEQTDEAPPVPSLKLEAVEDDTADEDPAEVAARDAGSEEQIWERIAGSTDPEDYRRYLEAYPDGAFSRIAALNLKALDTLGETRKRLEELKVAQQAATGQQLSLEELYWATIRESNLAEDFEAYLRSFPDGLFADLAQARIEALHRATDVADAIDPDGNARSRASLRAAAMQKYDRIPMQFVQYGLIALGYPLAKVTGVYDAETRRSARAFQASLSAAQTGRLTAQQTVDLLLAAASIGDEHAQTAVGIMMASGQGLQQDYALARLWLRQAAEVGNVYAQANLAILLRDGLGGKKDLDAAEALLQKAAEGGLAEAADALRNLRG